MGVSLQDAKAWLGIDFEDSLDDYRLTQILTGVKAQVDAFCNTPLVQRQLTQKFLGGADIWYLNACPVASIVSVTDPAGNSLTSSDYMLLEELGFLESRSGRFPTARTTDFLADRWTVTYTAGHFATEGAVAADAANAILDLVADYFHKAGPDVQSQRMGVENTLAFIPNPNTTFILPPRVQIVLSPYRRRSV